LDIFAHYRNPHNLTAFDLIACGDKGPAAGIYKAKIVVVDTVLSFLTTISPIPEITAEHIGVLVDLLKMIVVTVTISHYILLGVYVNIVTGNKAPVKCRVVSIWWGNSTPFSMCRLAYRRLCIPVLPNTAILE
jgi:hypothetical protein